MDIELRKMTEQIAMGLSKETTGFTIKEFSGHGDVFQNTSSTFINEDNSITTDVSLTLHRLSCGHVVGSNGSADLLGKCHVCDAWLCVRCEAGSICHRCNSLLCPSCRKMFKGIQYCSRCRIIEFIKSITFSGIRRIHEALSAEL